MKRLLVTGGAGYIGSVVVQRLLDEPVTEMVRVVDNALQNETPFSKSLHKKYEFVKCDVRKGEDMKKASEDVDTILHLAAIVGDTACDMAPNEAFEINVGAVENLIDIALNKELERIVFASTCSIYGLQPNNLDVHEHTTPNPTSFYGATKLEAERLFQKAYEENGLDVCILRLSTIYGPSPSMNFDIFANLFILNACRTKTIKLYGGDKWRPLLYTKDAAESFIDAAQAPSNMVSGELFNVGSNSGNYRIQEVAEIVAKEIKGTRIIKEPRPPDPRSYKVNFDKIGRILGFKPKYILRKGVRELRDLINNGTYEASS